MAAKKSSAKKTVVKASAPKKKTAAKESGDSASSVASRVLRKGKATSDEAIILAGSVLSQDETKGKRSTKKRP